MTDDSFKPGGAIAQLLPFNREATPVSIVLLKSPSISIGGETKENSSPSDALNSGYLKRGHAKRLSETPLSRYSEGQSPSNKLRRTFDKAKIVPRPWWERTASDDQDVYFEPNVGGDSIWPTEKADEMMELSLIDCIPFEVPMAVILCCWSPTVAKFSSTQSITMCDQDCSLVVVDFVGIGGELPPLHRGMILEINGARKVHAGPEKSLMFEHKSKILVTNVAQVSIVEGMEDPLENIIPAHVRVSDLEVGEPRSIGFMKMREIGGETKSSLSPNRKSRMIVMTDRFGDYTTLTLEGRDMLHANVLEVGSVYHLFGLRVEQHDGLNFLNGSIFFGFKKVEEGHPAQSGFDIVTLETLTNDCYPFLEKGIQVTGRLKNNIYLNRTTLVDGYHLERGIASLAVEAVCISTNLRRGNAVAVSGVLKACKGSLVLSEAVIAKAEDGDVRPKSEMKGAEIPMKIGGMSEQKENVAYKAGAEGGAPKQEGKEDIGGESEVKKNQSPRAPLSTLPQQESTKRSGSDVTVDSPATKAAKYFSRLSAIGRRPSWMGPLPGLGSVQERGCQQEGGESNEINVAIVWSTDEADEMTELSNVAAMPLDQEGTFTLCCWCPTVMRSGPVQKVMMSDAEDLLVPVKFVGLGGALPALARGMILELTGAKKCKSQYPSRILNHSIEVKTDLKTKVTIITGFSTPLVDFIPENIRIDKMEEGEPVSIGLMTVSKIGELIETTSTFSSGTTKYRKVTLKDQFGQSAFLTFYDGNCAHLDHLEEGKKYHLFGLRATRKGEYLNLSATAMFSFAAAIESSTADELKSSEVVAVTLEQLSRTFEHLDKRIKIKGRLKNPIHFRRTSLVDGFLIDNGIASIVIECTEVPDGMRRGDPAVAEGTLKSVKGTLVLADSVLMEANEEEVPSKDKMKGSEIPLTLSTSGGDQGNSSQSSSQSSH